MGLAGDKLNFSSKGGSYHFKLLCYSIPYRTLLGVENKPGLCQVAIYRILSASRNANRWNELPLKNAVFRRPESAPYDKNLAKTNAETFRLFKN